MAVIGLDIDGVLTDIHKFQLEKGEKFFKEKFKKDVVNRDAQDINEIFECSEKESRIEKAKEAVAQIENRHYAEPLTDDDNISSVQAYGITFYGKTCAVTVKRLK